MEGFLLLCVSVKAHNAHWLALPFLVLAPPSVLCFGVRTDTTNHAGTGCSRVSSQSTLRSILESGGTGVKLKSSILVQMKTKSITLFEKIVRNCFNVMAVCNLLILHHGCELSNIII